MTSVTRSSHRWWRRGRRIGVEGDERTAHTQPDDRPFGWSVEVSDWPIGKRSYDLSPGAAVRTLQGLTEIYDQAMASLADAGDRTGKTPSVDTSDAAFEFGG